MKYDKVKRNPVQLLSLTGFTREEFEEFLPAFELEWQEYYCHSTLSGKPRQRLSYNRKNSQLPRNADKLLFILSYLKNNPLQEYHGATYGMTQPQCNRWVHLLCEILRKTLNVLDQLPDRNHLRIEHIQQQCQQVLLDGTDRMIQRPQDEDRQKSCYSGKKNS